MLHKVVVFISPVTEFRHDRNQCANEEMTLMSV